MNWQLAMDTLAKNGRRLVHMAAEVTADQAQWRPDPTSWSILEVMCHVYDEEREDFRARLKHILAQAPPPWPPIDPQGWVTARNYAEQELAQVVAGFAAERQQSLVWLATLGDLGEADWQTSFQSPFRTITAGDMLASWVAHDVLHLRQLAELHWGYWQSAAVPYITEYAGSW